MRTLAVPGKHLPASCDGETNGPHLKVLEDWRTPWLERDPAEIMATLHPCGENSNAV
jgi:hypothetical protein